jgi:hypothetical protein
VDASYFYDRLYPLQGDVLRLLSSIETGFYLSGVTAASRGYLGHRFSDDLDLFVNDSPSFGLWSSRVIDRLASHPAWVVRVLLREARFVRIEVHASPGILKIEMINDVPSHLGSITVHPTLGRLDSAENILASKLTALAGGPLLRGCTGGQTGAAHLRRRTPAGQCCPRGHHRPCVWAVRCSEPPALGSPRGGLLTC